MNFPYSSALCSTFTVKRHFLMIFLGGHHANFSYINFILPKRVFDACYLQILATYVLHQPIILPGKKFSHPDSKQK